MLEAGARVGSYEIVAPLGAGGMGEVFRARDSKLGRDVALKILPDQFAQDSDRLGRFRREAQLLASLNHPNIAAIYGLEEAGDPTASGRAPVRALVLELVEGPTLADAIGSARTRASGPAGLPLADALVIGRQIAEALEAAHAQGVIHRDLKPANIKIRPDGMVKVLDFGLAKALESTTLPSDALASPTMTSPAMTRMGVILGTAAYMSPEQARGRAVDKRCDVWAFGCVLFEMLTGKRAFGGDDVTDTIAAVVRAEPEWSALPTETPAAIRRLLRRCLEKEQKERLPDIGSARLEIKDALASPNIEAQVVPGGAASAARPKRRPYAWIAAGAFLLATLGMALTMYSRRAPEDLRTLRFSVSPPEGWSLALTSVVGAASPAPLAVSPDGRRIAYVARNGEKQIIWVQALDELVPRMLTGTDAGAQPFWSPDGRFLAFMADGKLKKIDISGGPPITLCDVPPNANGGAWSPDGVLIFSTGGLGSVIQKVSASGGAATAITTVGKEDNAHLRPTLLPDGRHFLFAGSRGGSTSPIYVGSLDSRETVRLFESGSSNVRYAQGQLLFLREQTLMAQAFDARRLALTGEPFPVAEQVVGTAGPPPYALFSASDNGVLVYQQGAANITPRLQWFDRAGKEQPSLGDPAFYGEVALSPDGRRVAVTLPTPGVPNQARDIWLFDIARGFPTRLTFDPGDDANVVWSPDGTSVAFSSNRSGRWDLYQRLTNGAAGDEVLLADATDKEPLSWSPDGRFMLYGVSSALSTTKSNDVWVLPLSGEGRKPFPILQTTFNELNGRFSPDGRWVAYQSNESGRAEVYVVPFSGTPESSEAGKSEGKWQVSNGGGAAPRWRRDGREIFYVTPAPQLRLMAAPVMASGSSFAVGAPRSLLELPVSVFTQFQFTGSSYDVAPDGQRFIGITRPKQSATARPLTVIVNWSAGVKK